MLLADQRCHTINCANIALNVTIAVICNSEVNIREAFKYYLAGSGKLGPIADLVENLAPHFLGPSLPSFGKLGPRKMLEWQIGPPEIRKWQIGPPEIRQWQIDRTRVR